MTVSKIAKSSKSAFTPNQIKTAVHFFLWPLAAATFLIFVLFANLHSVPKPLDHLDVYGGDFSEARAKQFLIKLEGLGPKSIGTAANEVGAPGVLISEIFKLPTFKESPWDFKGGLSHNFLVYSGANVDQQHVSNFSASSGCVCPEDQTIDQTNLQELFDQTHQRLIQALWVCAPRTVLSASVDVPDWIDRIRGLLEIDAAGCNDVPQWIGGELYLSYLLKSYQVQLPTLPTSLVSKLSKLQQEVLHHLATATISGRVSFSPFLGHPTPGHCTSSEALEACSNGQGSQMVYPIARSILSQQIRGSSQTKQDQLMFWDISLSHDYSGNFILDLPSCGSINNIYLNMTNLALRVTPLDLFVSQQKSISQINSVFEDMKSSLLSTYQSNEFPPNFDQVETIFDNNRLQDVQTNEDQFVEHLPPALIVASHFDTAVGSPGGADAGSGVAIALETTRNVLHRNGFRLQRPLMIVLNGGEEHILPAAYGFIVRHPWILEATEVFNLEAAGNWGKENLLRSGRRSRHLLDLYRQVVWNPQAMSPTHDAFESNLVPGLTDFEFFRNIAKLEGFDFAFGTGGYFYHTADDSINNIQNGSIQHYGNTVSRLTLSLLSSRQSSILSPTAIRELSESRPPQHDPYFDYLGFTTILLPSELVHSPCVVLLCFLISAVLLFRQRNRWGDRESWWSTSGGALIRYFVMVGIAIGCNALFGAVLSLCGFGMRWYSDPIRVLILFTPVPVAVMLEVTRRIAKSGVYKNEDPVTGGWKLEEELFLSSTFVWIALSLIGCFFRSRSVHVPQALLFGCVAGRLFGSLLRRVLRRPHTSRCLTAGTILGQLCMMVVAGQPLVTLIDHLGPVFGRTVLPFPPDLALGFLIALFITLMAPLVFLGPFARLAFCTPALSFTRKVLWCSYIPLCLSFVLSHPTFNEDIPQRVDVIHFTTRFHDLQGGIKHAESGVLLQAGDDLGFSDDLLARYEEVFQQFWREPEGAPSTATSYFDAVKGPVVVNETAGVSQFKHFSVPNNPQQGFFRYPQGALFRKVAGKKLVVFPDLIPPFFDPETVGLGLSSVPVDRTWDPRWQLTQPFSLSPESSLVYSSRHRPTTLSWRVEQRSWGIQRVHMKLGGGPRMIFSIPAEEPVIAWSFSPELPLPREECDCYGNIYGAGVASPMEVDFWVDIRGSVEFPHLSVGVSSNYFDVLTPPLKVAAELQARLRKDKMFVTTTTVIGELGHWQIPLGISTTSTPAPSKQASSVDVEDSRDASEL